MVLCSVGRLDHSFPTTIQVLTVERTNNSGPGGNVREFWFRGGGKGRINLPEGVVEPLSWYLPRDYHLCQLPNVWGAWQWW